MPSHQACFADRRRWSKGANFVLNERWHSSQYQYQFPGFGGILIGKLGRRRRASERSHTSPHWGSADARLRAPGRIGSKILFPHCATRWLRLQDTLLNAPELSALKSSARRAKTSSKSSAGSPSSPAFESLLDPASIRVRAPPWTTQKANTSAQSSSTSSLRSASRASSSTEVRGSARPRCVR